MVRLLFDALGSAHLRLCERRQTPSIYHHYQYLVLVAELRDIFQVVPQILTLQNLSLFYGLWSVSTYLLLHQHRWYCLHCRFANISLTPHVVIWLLASHPVLHQFEHSNGPSVQILHAHRVGYCHWDQFAKMHPLWNEFKKCALGIEGGKGAYFWMFQYHLVVLFEDILCLKFAWHPHLISRGKF